MKHECQCSEPGECPLFKRKMNITLHRLCQEDSERGEKYRKLWAEQRDNPPGFLQKAVNYGKAVIQHALDLGVKVSEEFRKKRVEVCRSCDRLNQDGLTCNECGCPVEDAASWRSKDCPLKKWPELPAEEKEKGWGAPMIRRGCGGCGSGS